MEGEKEGGKKDNGERKIEDENLEMIESEKGVYEFIRINSKRTIGFKMNPGREIAISYWLLA